MKTNELISLVAEYGSPINAALSTGRTEEMIVCYEGRIERNFNDLQNGIEDPFEKTLKENQLNNMRSTVSQLYKIKRGEI